MPSLILYTVLINFIYYCIGCCRCCFVIQIVIMKGVNHFDYPTAIATNYKAYREELAPTDDKKGHYKRVIKMQSQNERERAKNGYKKKKELQAMEEANKMREQIERKKQELQQLNRLKQEAVEKQRQAIELAKIKIEQDKIKKIEQDKKWEENNENANYRFRDALRRLQAERQENSYKERQAMQRRKVAQEVEKQQREKAIKYKAYLQEKEEEQKVRAFEEQKRNEQLFRNGMMKHGLAKNIDYSKTCFHNPKFVFQYDQQQQTTAFKTAEQEEKKQKQLLNQRKQKQQQSRKKSLERGEKALQRINSQKEYKKYCNQAEQQQKEYNLQRIQVGKKNQYTGLKPLTLNQLQVNKKIRSEQQFEEMFVKYSPTPIQQFANKYTIMETKYNPIPQKNNSAWKETQQDEDSLQVYNPPTAYPYEINNDSMEGVESELKEKQMGETRVGQNYKRQQLSYSQSEDDSSLHD